MRRVLPILVLVALATLAAVALAQVGSAPAARLTTTAATGSFEVTNSDDGQPIFAATGIAPGGSAVGTVTIEDTGSAAATLVLRPEDIVDSPGPGGGLLSDRLELRVVDVTAPGAPRNIYSGPLATMPDQPAGRLEPGEARTFEFTATFPDGGEPSFQNAVQGASTTVAYAWIATEAAAEEGGKEEGAPAGGEAGRPGGEAPGSGQAGGGGPGNGDAGGVEGRKAGLELTVPKIRRTLRAARMVVWARCDASCRVVVRGRLLARAAGHGRGAPVRFVEKRMAAPGRQRLRIPIPRKLGTWLRHQLPPRSLRARLRFTALGSEGRRDVVRKQVRLRVGGR
jgi:hypothetical protein